MPAFAWHRRVGHDQRLCIDFIVYGAGAYQAKLVAVYVLCVEFSFLQVSSGPSQVVMMGQHRD